MQTAIRAWEAAPEGKSVGSFRAGDTVQVNVKVKEGEKERIQTFEGVVIALKRRGASSSFTVRKISYGVGVERIFPLFSPSIDSIVRISQGEVRRAKLYYLRDLSGRKARIFEKDLRNKAGSLPESDVPEVVPANETLAEVPA